MVILNFLQIALASNLKSRHFTAEKCRVVMVVLYLWPYKEVKAKVWGVGKLCTLRNVFVRNEFGWRRT